MNLHFGIAIFLRGYVEANLNISATIFIIESDYFEGYTLVKKDEIRCIESDEKLYTKFYQIDHLILYIL